MQNIFKLISFLLILTFMTSCDLKKPDLSIFCEGISYSIASAEVKVRNCDERENLDKYWNEKLLKVSFCNEKSIGDICNMIIPFALPLLYKYEVPSSCQFSRADISEDLFTKTICDKLKARNK